MRRGQITLKTRASGGSPFAPIGNAGAPVLTQGVVDRAKGFKELSAGNHVEFELVPNGDRWRAKNVTLSFHRAKEAARA